MLTLFNPFKMLLFDSARGVMCVNPRLGKSKTNEPKRKSLESASEVFSRYVNMRGLSLYELGEVHRFHFAD
jgi:hypothetical protein